MFVCRYFDSLSETVYFADGDDIQSSWENLLDMLESEHEILEKDVDLNDIEFFLPCVVSRGTKTVWEWVE